MRLTDHTDYSLRVLMYLNQTKKLTTLNELAENLDISKNNLIKVSNQLAKIGWINTTRGRAGGLCINEVAGELTLREIIERTEENFNMAECFGNKNCACTFIRMCPFKNSLRRALEAFLGSLEKTTLNGVTPKSRF